jgi:hypothetical protein
MSIHSTNASIAARNHAAVFGNGADCPDAVYFRRDKKCNWELLDGAVAHGEFITQKKTDRDSRKVVERKVFIDRGSQPDLHLNSEIRIGSEACSPTYNITHITAQTTRTTLHLVRGEVQEVARPGYRSNNYGRM